MDPSQQHAEQVAIQTALARGYLDPQRLEQARQLAAQPGSPGLLRILGQRFLTPEHTSVLGQIYQGALSADSSATLASTPPAQAEPPSGTHFVQPPGGRGVQPSVPYTQTVVTPPPGSQPPGFSSLGPQGASAAAGPVSGLRAGDTLGPYRLIRELARGGMGVVYVAEREGLDRRVALKQLLEGGAGDGVERFLIEARIAARLRHPNIVGIHDVGQVGESPYFAMDFIEGEDLDQVIKREGQLDPRRSAALTQKLAGALAYAHERSVLHRDIKPANVLVTPEDEPVLTDFGLAKDVDAGGDSGLTQAGAIMGTPSYMPPEQADGKKDLIDRRADIYSLGGTLYACLTGRAPFEGSSPLNTITKVLREEVVPPRKLQRAVPRDLEVIVLTCLAKDPQERYSTAKDLEADLRRFLNDEPITARPPSLGDRLEKWVRRNRALTAFGFVAAGLLVAAAVAVFFGVRASAAREARVQTEQALAALDELAGEDPEVRLSSSLKALQAAGRYRAAVGAESDALYLQALLALGDAACEGRQLTLAQQAYEEAAELAPGDAAVSERQAELTRVQNLQRDAVKEILDAVRAGDPRRFVQESDPVFELVRYPGQRDQLVSALDGVSQRLLELQVEFLRTGCTQPEELEPELEGFRALCRSGERPSDAVVEGRFPAIARARRRLEATAGTRTGYGILLRNHLAGQVSDERRVARIACQALGRLGAEAQDAIPAIQRYLAVEPKLQAGIEASCALARIGTEEALDAIRPHRGRLHDMRLDYLIGRAAERLGLQERAANPETSRERLLEQIRNAFGVQDLSQAIAFCTEALASAPDDALARAWRAHALALQGEYEPAKEDLAKVFKRPQEDSDVLARAAFAQIQLGQPEVAVINLRKAVERAKSPERAQELRIPYAHTLMATNQIDLAKAQIETVLESGPNAKAYAMRGLLHLVLGELDVAEVAIKRAVEIDPNETDALLGLARLAMQRNLYQRAAPLYDRVLERRLADPQVISERALIKAAMGQTDDALVDLERALELSHTAFARANILGNRAKCFHDLGRLDEALRDAEEVVRLVPDSGSGWIKVGKLRLERGDMDGGTEAVRRALDLGTSPEGFALRGKLQLIKGNFALGLQDLDKAVKLAPKNPYFRADRAAGRVQVGQLQGALEDLTFALEVDPVNVVALRTRAQIYAQTGKLREARADARRLATVSPSEPETHFVQAMVAFYAKSYQEALASAEKALAVTPNEPQLINLYGQCLRMLKRPKEAIPVLERLLKQPPPGGLAMVHLQLGACCAEAGEVEGAKKHLRLYLKDAHPQDPNRAQAQAVLAELEAGK